MRAVGGTTSLRDRVVGIDQPTPLLDGSMVPYVNLDNAASTPPLRDVADAVAEFLPLYSSVHRGSGFKSRLSTMVYDQAHEIIARFVGADPATNTVIFGKNTTEAVNKLSYRLPFDDDSVVITTVMEHHSNDLPWRNRARCVYVAATPDGRLDEEDFDRQLRKYEGRIAIVAVTAASNVTGFIQPVHRLARMAHDVGAKIVVDVAQLAPHRRVDMKPDADPEHLDFVVLAGHKMYAPLGAGALVGPAEFFLESQPEYTGGGTVDAVTLDDVHWAGMPDRDEAGSPNVVGAMAMAKAAQVLMEVGMDRIAAHEAHLTAYTLERLAAVPNVRVYGDTNPATSDTRVGVIPFSVEDVHHYLVAAVLGYEGGVGVRSGCFCAHPYVVHLLQLPQEALERWKTRVLRGDRRGMPGMVRASFGCYSDTGDADRLVEMVDRVARGAYQGQYDEHPASGEFLPRGYREPLARFFTLEAADD
ncbi:MAG: aminotransferase class V-fold PLP-dependent enzyme [Gemmatimonadota bacterium]|nr:MAG: aminotransferase class V-fold PLP-dependent enzyme [Gemmatimonadota bacterium]